MRNRFLSDWKRMVFSSSFWPSFFFFLFLAKPLVFDCSHCSLFHTWPGDLAEGTSWLKKNVRNPDHFCMGAIILFSLCPDNLQVIFKHELKSTSTRTSYWPLRWVRCLLWFPQIAPYASRIMIHSILYWSHLFKGLSSLWDCQLYGDGSHTWLVKCRSHRT